VRNKRGLFLFECAVTNYLASFDLYELVCHLSSSAVFSYKVGRSIHWARPHLACSQKMATLEIERKNRKLQIERRDLMMVFFQRTAVGPIFVRNRYVFLLLLPCTTTKPVCHSNFWTMEIIDKSSICLRFFSTRGNVRTANCELTCWCVYLLLGGWSLEEMQQYFFDKRQTTMQIRE
jgi:hypothetical protein